MEDKQLLEMAAKAIDCDIEFTSGAWTFGQKTECRIAGGDVWNPLLKKSDLYELAKKLKFVVDFGDETVLYFVESERKWYYLEDMNISIERRIVRAAAEIGKGIK